MMIRPKVRSAADVENVHFVSGEPTSEQVEMVKDLLRVFYYMPVKVTHVVVDRDEYQVTFRREKDNG